MHDRTDRAVKHRNDDEKQLLAQSDPYDQALLTYIFLAHFKWLNRKKFRIRNVFNIYSGPKNLFYWQQSIFIQHHFYLEIISLVYIFDSFCDKIDAVYLYSV